MKGTPMKKRLLSLLLCLMLLPCAARAETELKRFTASFLELFNTVTMIVGYAEDADAFRATAQQIYDELEVYHQLYDIYNTYEGMNNLRTVNDMAGVAPVKVDEKIIRLLLFCREMHDATGGLVDATMGSVLSLWHDARSYGIDWPEEAYLPDSAALQVAALHTGFDKVVIDEEASTVFITDPMARLDVGAIGKGYAVEQVSRSLPEGLLLSVGGNIRATGPNPVTGMPWTAGVQNPENMWGEYLHVLYVDGVSVVTSGDYQRYYTVNGQRYGHIVDPRTLYPTGLWRAVCILAPDSGVADALSTALYLLPAEEGQALLDQYQAEAMWIGNDGSQRVSPGFEAYIRK